MIALFQIALDNVKYEGVIHLTPAPASGAICAGQSIKTAFWKGWDDPGVVPGIKWTTEECQGLGILGKYDVFPHFQPMWEECERSPLCCDVEPHHGDFLLGAT